MVERIGTRVLITTKQGDRQILSVTEEQPGSNRAGDLIIGLMPARNYRSDLLHLNSETQNHKYTVHNSRDPEGNHITDTVTLNNKKEEKHRMFTKAIKKTKKLAPLFVRTYPHLSAKSFDVKGTSSKLQHNLGMFDQDATTLVLGAFVGPSDICVDDPIRRDFRIEKLQFDKFTLLIMWCRLMGAASIEAGCFIKLSTTKPNDIKDANLRSIMEKIINGFDVNEAMDCFIACRDILQQRFAGMYAYYFKRPIGRTTFSR